MFNRKIQYLPNTLGNRFSSLIDTTNIEKLGWKPTLSISDHINSFINDFV